MFSLVANAFLLGISTGVYCFSQCGLVIMPYVFSENTSGIKSQSLLVGKFLLGRFIAYTTVGLLIGFLSEKASAAHILDLAPTEIIAGISYIILAILLIYNSVHKRPEKNNCRYNKSNKYACFPALLGIFTGINICPPFISAVTISFETKSMISGAIFFMLFFMATSIFILPLIFSGLVKRMEEIKTIARFVSVLAGIYIGIQGVFYLLNVI